MNPDEIHALLEASEPPFTIKTKGGRDYPVTDRANVWTPAAYEGMICVAIVGKGIVVLRVSAIEGIHVEQDVAGAR